MASIRQAAQDVLAEAREEIAWIAVWKDGCGWMTMCFWPDFTEKTGEFTFEDYDQEYIENIVKQDSKAIIVNGYYDNLGSAETMTRESLAEALRWHYERQMSLVVDCLKGARA